MVITISLILAAAMTLRTLRVEGAKEPMRQR